MQALLPSGVGLFSISKRLLAVFATGALLLCLGACAGHDQQTMVVYLVRHAEKEPGQDPALSPAGRERAELLALILRDTHITRIHSSDYRRTRETAAPVAGQLKRQVSIYDAGDLPALARKLLEERGHHLVVGHSNTTPDMVTLLGGSAGQEIDEASEYDRLYIVSVATDGSVNTELLRYGRPYLSPAATQQP